MGNHKFRFSDMMPNAWFYKLRDMRITMNSSSSHPHSSKNKKKKKKPSSNTTAKTLSQKSSQNLNQTRQPYCYSSDFSCRSGEFYSMSTPQKASDHLLPSFSSSFFPDQPRRSSEHRRTRRKAVYKPSPRRELAAAAAASFVDSDDHCSCRDASSVAANGRDLFDSSSDDCSADIDYLKSPPSDFESNESINGGFQSWNPNSRSSFSSSATDIIIDVDAKSYARKIKKLDGFDTILELDLPPILTKPAKFNVAIKEPEKFRSPKKPELAGLSVKIVQEESVKAQTDNINCTPPGTRKSVSYSSGIKLRANSPKLASKKVQGSGRKSISRRTKSSTQKKGSSSVTESFAIVKASLDPEKDFRESMMEMIVENNIRASKDLEELLACYLSLNSDEYHGLIIKAFEQIWFNMPDLNL